MPGLMTPQFTVLFFVSVAGGLFCTYFIRKFAIKFGIVNYPNQIVPQHIRPIAYLGGVGIIGGILTGLCFIAMQKLTTKFDFPIYALLFGSIAFLIMGVADDLKPFSAIQKFLLQFLLASVCVFLGFQVSIFNHKIADIALSVFWILLVVNAVNFTDVCDGLVGSIGATVFLFLGFFKLEPYCMITGGAILGFLFFNWPKASIFLGDAGSHLVGFLLATVSLLMAKDLNTINTLIWMLLIPGIPIFELVFITTVRIQKGLPFWKGSPDHFSLRLQKSGMSRAQIDLMAAVISFCLCFFACTLSHLNQYLKFSILILIVVFIVWVWKMLLRLNVN